MIAIGIGCRRGASQGAIAAMIEEALAKVQHLGEPTQIYSIDAKRDEEGLAGAARALDLPLAFLPPEALRAVADRIATRSARAEARFGVASVSEGSALAGAGRGARLIARRMIGDGVTCAIARGDGR
jgi:cobalt-precorrin 5A hydrolase